MVTVAVALVMYVLGLVAGVGYGINARTRYMQTGEVPRLARWLGYRPVARRE